MSKTYNVNGMTCGGCGNSVASGETRLDNEFLHDSNVLRYIRQAKITPEMNNPG